MLEEYKKQYDNLKRSYKNWLTMIDTHGALLSIKEMKYYEEEIEEVLNKIIYLESKPLLVS